MKMTLPPLASGADGVAVAVHRAPPHAIGRLRRDPVHRPGVDHRHGPRRCQQLGRLEAAGLEVRLRARRLLG